MYFLQILLAYCTHLVAELLQDCKATLSCSYQETLQLRPAAQDKKVPGDYQELSTHPGFDPRLCYGTVTIAYNWQQEEPAQEKAFTTLTSSTSTGSMMVGFYC